MHSLVFLLLTMTPSRPDYRMSAAALTTQDTWLASALLFVRDEETFSPQRLREHLSAVHARLIDRLGALMAEPRTPGRREERELRFLLDELIEALHRLDDLPHPGMSMVS